MSVWWRPRGCVVWYDFAELKGDAVYDLSGHGNHGKVYGAQWRRGPLIGSLYFDGTGGYVRAPYDASLQTADEMTVEALLYPTKLNVLQNPVSRDLMPPGERCWQLAVNTDNRFRFIFFSSDVAYTFYSNRLAGRRWQYVAVTYKAYSHVSFFVDGVHDVTHEHDLKMDADLADLVVGNLGDLNWPFNGFIALVRVYGRVLSEKTIRAHARYLLGRVSRIRRRFG